MNQQLQNPMHPQQKPAKIAYVVLKQGSTHLQEECRSFKIQVQIVPNRPDAEPVF